MPTLTDLENAIVTLLNLPGIAGVLQLNSVTRERAFEAYVVGLIVRAVRQVEGPTSAIITGIRSGPNPIPVVLRGGPGRLGSRVQNFAYVLCHMGQKEFEIHIDVQYAGTSGAIHEADVSLYDHAAAERIRSSVGGGNVFPPSSKLIAAAECKFYDSDLSTSLGRTFVGLVDDFGTLVFKVFATNGIHSGLLKYFRPLNRPRRFFDLAPTNAQTEKDCVSWLATELRKWAGV